MVVCADTSFLFALYGDDAHTGKALAWVGKSRMPIRISVLAEYELGNAFRFSEFSMRLPSRDAARFLSHYEADRDAGRIIVEVCNLASVVTIAKRLSLTHTSAHGHRGFDILHVATALELEATTFLTFDTNQKKLVEAEGLVVPC